MKARRPSLADVAFDRLFRAIRSGAYADGERLPTEHALAAELEISRPVLREALRRLAERGLVQARQGSGTFVRQSGLRAPLGFGRPEGTRDLAACYAFRLAIEPEAAAVAAAEATPAALGQIEAALDLLGQATRAAHHREDADFDFHLAIARASGNRYFAMSMEELKDHIAVGMRRHGASLKVVPAGLEHVFEEHGRIHAAIRDGDGETARVEMRAHLEGSRARALDQ